LLWKAIEQISNLRSLARIKHITDSSTPIRNPHAYNPLSVIPPQIQTFHVLPKNPAKVLKTSSVSMFGLNAVGTCKTAKIEKQTRYSLLLPKVSDSGAKIRGPIPRDTTKPVVAPTTASGDVLRSEAICSMPGVNMELARGLRTGEC